MTTTEDIFNFDLCHRLQQYSAFDSPRIPLGVVMNEALTVGLVKGKGEAAANHVMARAAIPGLALTGIDVYKVAIHHAHLVEVIVTYLLGDEGKWEPADAVTVDGREFQPMSFKVPNQNRLRRVVMCSRFDDLRKLEEVNSWRSVADTTATGLPMLINAIVIGSAIKGMRPNVWTRSYEHPRTKGLRIKIAIPSDGRHREFNQNWHKMFREQSGKSPKQWLQMMQKDEAFDEVVYSFESDTHDLDSRDQLLAMMDAINNGGSMEMRRSACFGTGRCQFAQLCHHSPPLTPMEMGWVNKIDLSY